MKVPQGSIPYLLRQLAKVQGDAMLWYNVVGTTDATGIVNIPFDPPMDIVRVQIACGTTPSGRTVVANYAKTKNAAGKVTSLKITFTEVLAQSNVVVTALSLVLNTVMGYTRAVQSAGAGVEYTITVAGK